MGDSTEAGEVQRFRDRHVEFKNSDVQKDDMIAVPIPAPSLRLTHY